MMRWLSNGGKASVLSGSGAVFSLKESVDSDFVTLQTRHTVKENTKKQKAVRALADKSVSVFSDQI